ncbi:MAG: thiamine diphosphokinase [Acidimicrobiales bacterium]
MDTGTPSPSQSSYVIIVGATARPDGPDADGSSPLRIPVTLPPAAVVVAADSGLDHARAAGLAVDHLVGDLDSVSPAAVERARAGGAVVHAHAADKDATDFELATDVVVALERSARCRATSVGPAKPAAGECPDAARPRLLVLGAGGGRLDHLLADVMLLAGPLVAGYDVDAAFGSADIAIVRPGRRRSLALRAGAQVSLLPLHGPARAVTTTGLRWPLVHADLAPGTTRGLSNEVVGDVTVSVAEGVLAVIAPGTAAPVVAPRTTAYDASPHQIPSTPPPRSTP